LWQVGVAIVAMETQQSVPLVLLAHVCRFQQYKAPLSFFGEDNREATTRSNYFCTTYVAANNKKYLRFHTNYKPILTKVAFSRQICTEVHNIKLHGNPSRDSHADT
jgi:hypothetical protein